MELCVIISLVLQHRSATPAATADSFVKDYTKKRWLILSLLSAEIEGLVVYENPLETREGLVNLLQSRLYFGSGAATAAQGNVGKQVGEKSGGGSIFVHQHQESLVSFPV